MPWTYCTARTWAPFQHPFFLFLGWTSVSLCSSPGSNSNGHNQSKLSTTTMISVTKLVNQQFDQIPGHTFKGPWDEPWVLTQHTIRSFLSECQCYYNPLAITASYEHDPQLSTLTKLLVYRPLQQWTIKKYAPGYVLLYFTFERTGIKLLLNSIRLKSKKNIIDGFHSKTRTSLKFNWKFDQIFISLYDNCVFLTIRSECFWVEMIFWKNPGLRRKLMLTKRKMFDITI